MKRRKRQAVGSRLQASGAALLALILAIAPVAGQEVLELGGQVPGGIEGGGQVPAPEASADGQVPGPGQAGRRVKVVTEWPDNFGRHGEVDVIYQHEVGPLGDGAEAVMERMVAMARASTAPIVIGDIEDYRWIDDNLEAIRRGTRAMAQIPGKVTGHYSWPDSASPCAPAVIGPANPGVEGGVEGDGEGGPLCHAYAEMGAIYVPGHNWRVRDIAVPRAVAIANHYGKPLIIQVAQRELNGTDPRGPHPQLSIRAVEELAAWIRSIDAQLDQPLTVSIWSNDFHQNATIPPPANTFRPEPRWTKQGIAALARLLERMINDPEPIDFRSRIWTEFTHHHGTAWPRGLGLEAFDVDAHRDWLASSRDGGAVHFFRLPWGNESGQFTPFVSPMPQYRQFLHVLKSVGRERPTGIYIGTHVAGGAPGELVDWPTLAVELAPLVANGASGEHPFIVGLDATWLDEESVALMRHVHEVLSREQRDIRVMVEPWAAKLPNRTTPPPSRDFLYLETLGLWEQRELLDYHQDYAGLEDRVVIAVNGWEVGHLCGRDPWWTYTYQEFVDCTRMVLLMGFTAQIKYPGGFEKSFAEFVEDVIGDGLRGKAGGGGGAEP